MPPRPKVRCLGPSSRKDHYEEAIYCCLRSRSRHAGCSGAVHPTPCRSVYLAPGITFRQEGFKQEGESTGLNYIAVPVNLGIRVGLADAIAVSVEAGPTFAYGLSSTSSVKDAVDAFKSGGLKRFDAGINASSAIEYSKAYLRVGTDLGMVNTLKEAVQKASSKNASFFIGVGYRF